MAAVCGWLSVRPALQNILAYLDIRLYYRGGTGETGFFLGAAVSHLEGTETSQRAAVWESTGPPPCSRGGIWLYPDEHNQF